MYLHEDISRIADSESVQRIAWQGMFLADLSEVTRLEAAVFFEVLADQDLVSRLPPSHLGRAQVSPPNSRVQTGVFNPAKPPPQSPTQIGAKAKAKALAAGKSPGEAAKIAQIAIDAVNAKDTDKPKSSA